MNSKPLRSWREFAVAPPGWLVLLAGAAILALRRPDQIANPQLWAEDGIFFFQAREIGWPAMTLELAGYFQLAPRVIAAIATWGDPAWVPHVFVGCSLALTLYTMSRVLSPRCRLPLRPWCALAIVLAPDAAEVILNAGNIHWILAVGFVVLLLSDDPRGRGQSAHDFVAAIFVGLSGPFSIVMAPFFAWRALLRRTSASVVLAALVAACAALQAISVLRHPQPLPANARLDGFAMSAFPGVRIAGGSLLGPWLPANLPWLAAAALSIAVIAAIAFLALRSGDNRLHRVALGLVFGSLLASTLYRCWHSMPILCVPDNATRYVYPLQILLLWLLLASAHDGARGVRFACVGAALWILIVNVPRLRQPPLPDVRWADYAPRLRNGEEVTVPINPSGWTFTFPARKP